MARSYANITTAVWRDPDFRKLSCNAQRLYLMLLTQPDISSCGVLSLTFKRWSGNASDSDPDSLSIALHELEDALFVVVDWDREELLIRTFVKWDGGANNSKRRPAILAAAHAIQSPVLMQVTAYEFDKLGIDHTLPVSPMDSLSDRASDSPSDRPRVGDSYVSTLPTPNPQPTTHNPDSVRAAKPMARGTRLPEDWQPSPRLVEWVTSEYPAVNGRVETDKFRDYWHGKSGKDATKVDWDATFRNWIRNAAERMPGASRQSRGQPATRVATADQRLADGMALAQRLAAQDAAPNRQEIAP